MFSSWPLCLFYFICSFVGENHTEQEGGGGGGYSRKFLIAPDTFSSRMPPLHIVSTWWGRNILRSSTVGRFVPKFAATCQSLFDCLSSHFSNFCSVELQLILDSLALFSSLSVALPPLVICSIAAKISCFLFFFFFLTQSIREKICQTSFSKVRSLLL